MISFFPIPYPDETLYSVISRYKVWSGNTNSKELLREIYGKETLTASRHLSSDIKILRKNLPENYPFTEEEIIKNLTLYNYYLAFSTNERAKTVYKYMLQGEGSKIFSTLGISNNSINSNMNLKYCEECLKEDKKLYGEGYWHREHQLYGILICSKHKISLKEIKGNKITNKQEFININHLNLPSEKVIINCNDDIITKQMKLIDNSNKILNNCYMYRELNFFRNFYVDELIKKGISDNKNRLNQDILVDKFLEYYGEDYLKIIGCKVERENKNNWVIKIARKHRTFFHPLYHLLMIDFLDIDIDYLFGSGGTHFIQNEKKTKKSLNDKEYYRNKWSNLIKNNLGKSKSELRNLDCSTYTWLYRYDKEWLMEVSPKKNRKQGIKKIDWNKRDEEILKEVKKFLSETLNDKKQKPIRITIGTISKGINRECYLARNIKRLPKTEKYLKEHLETVEDFQKRRIKWIEENCFQDEIISEWKVKRKAGIR